MTSEGSQPTSEPADAGRPGRHGTPYAPGPAAELHPPPDYGERSYHGSGKLVGNESYCTSLIDRAVDQLGGLDILVNLVAYQMAQSDGLDLDAAHPRRYAPEKVAEFGANTPLGQPGQPAELAAAYVFLASADSSYVTGVRIAVTGGRLTA